METQDAITLPGTKVAAAQQIYRLRNELFLAEQAAENGVEWARLQVTLIKRRLLLAQRLLDGSYAER